MFKKVPTKMIFFSFFLSYLKYKNIRKKKEEQEYFHILRFLWKRIDILAAMH